MSNTIVAYPLHAVCQLLMSANISCGTCSTDVQMPEKTVLPEGYTAFPDVGVAYKFYGFGRTWNSAKKDCTARGTNLAVIDSFKKIGYVTKMLKPGVGTWVGVHRFFDDAEWVSLKTATSLVALPWAPNEPESQKADEKCASLWSDGRGLFATGCNDPYYFICEIEL